MFKKPKTANFRGSARKAITGRKRRANLIDQQTDQSGSSTGEDTTCKWIRKATFRLEGEDKQSSILNDD